MFCLDETNDAMMLKNPLFNMKPKLAVSECYSASIPRENILLLCDEPEVDSFLFTLESLLKEEAFVLAGIDSEWKPINPMLPGVALLQIAINDMVYLVDIVKLSAADHISEENVWTKLYHKFFTNEVCFCIINSRCYFIIGLKVK